jgi:hypothetical protein
MVAPGSQTPGKLGPELDAYRRFTDGQGLSIGVHGDELNTLNILSDHAGNGIAAATT